MRQFPNSYIGLARYGKAWVPAIIFTESLDRAVFLAIADWLCQEFPVAVIERYGGEQADQKEYWTMQSPRSKWMLARCYYPLGISLDTDCPEDLPLFEQIARSIGARPWGWRYRITLLKRWLAGKGGVNGAQPEESAVD